LKLDYFVPPANDAGALAALHVACWQETYAGIVPEEALRNLPVAEKLAMWKGVLGDAGLFKLAVRTEAELAGFILCGPAREGAADWADGEIYAIYIRKAVQRLGIGTTFMARAAHFWLERRGENLAVLSHPRNAAAAGFYEALGARKIAAGGSKAEDVAADQIHVFSELGRLAGETGRTLTGA